MRRVPVLGLLGAALLATVPVQRAPAQTPHAIVAITLDTSGSVGAGDLARTRDLALALLQALPAGSEVAVFTFDDQSRVVVPRTSKADAVRDAVTAVRTSGRFTALHDALYDASRYLRDAPPARKAIVLVTDGKDENSSLNLDDGLQVAKDSGIPVFAVGVGRVQEKVLRRIAKLTAGEYADIAFVSGPDLAGKILALPTPIPAPPTEAAARTSAAALAGAPPQPPPSRARGALWLVLIAGVLLAAVLLLVALTHRTRPPATALAVASTEAAQPAGPTELEAAPVEEDEAYSPTVIARMDVTEEYLEKTVTLSEKPVLTIRSGPRDGQTFILAKDATMSIGRARANDIVLDDVSISSQHCRIRFDGSAFVLHDLKSTNGTFVNDQRVARHPLRTGDVIKLGETQLVFKLDQRKA